MPHEQQLQAYSLLHYAETMLLPLTKRKLTEDSLNRVLQYSLFEAFFWLLLGIENGVFDQREARHVAIHYYYPIFNDAEACLSEPASLINPFSGAILRNFMRTKELPIRMESRYDASLVSIFQDGIATCARFLNSALLPDFITLLIWEGESAWRHKSRAEINWADVVNQLAGLQAADYPLPFAFAGVLLALEHMIELDRLFTICDSDSEMMLIRSVYRIHSWSLNFHNATFASRFEELVAEASANLQSESRESKGLIRYEKDGLIVLAKRLIRDWRARGSLSRAVPA